MISNPFCMSLDFVCFVENFLSVYRKDIGLSFSFFVMGALIFLVEKRTEREIVF